MENKQFFLNGMQFITGHSPVYLIGCDKLPENILMYPFMFLGGGVGGGGAP